MMECGFKEYKRSEIRRGHLNLGGENPNGERIDVNSLYFEKNSKPWIGIMGEYHFSRDSRENWYRELAKIKAGGITVVSTYLFWIYHEEEEGIFDFKGDKDIREFVLLCKKLGLDVVLRVGPWAHGECRNGGLPDWLLKKPFKLRDNNPEYLSLAENWYSHIAKEVEGLFYKDGGNIIAVQIENELVDNAEHIGKLKEIALRSGLVAPLYTATGWNSKYGAKIPVKEVVPVFGGYADAPWAKGTSPLPLSKHYAFYTERNDSAIGLDLIKGKGENEWQLPYGDYPFATCEIGAGMQPTHHRRVVINGMDAYAMALVMLGVGNNLPGYYMYHGGTNKISKTTLNESKDTGYPNDYPILNYDFGTAISQYGEIREQYRLLNIMHLFINEFGSMLAPMEHVGAASFTDENDPDHVRYCMRTDGEAGFVFVNNYQRHASSKSFENISFNAMNVKFPEITVREDSSFFMPFNFKVLGKKIEYMTAQPLFTYDGIFFAMEVPGTETFIKMENGQEHRLAAGISEIKDCDGLKVMLMRHEDARFLRMLDGRPCIGVHTDLYFTEEDGICSAEDGNFEYYEWEKGSFKKRNIKKAEDRCSVSLTECAPAFKPDPMLSRELNLEPGDKDRKLTWYRLTVSGKTGFNEFSLKYDVAQIYADGKLVADSYYDGCPWKVPAKILAGREVYLVTSELRNDIYIEPESTWKRSLTI